MCDEVRGPWRRHQCSQVLPQWRCSRHCLQRRNCECSLTIDYSEYTLVATIDSSVWLESWPANQDVHQAEYSVWIFSTRLLQEWSHSLCWLWWLHSSGMGRSQGTVHYRVWWSSCDCHVTLQGDHLTLWHHHQDRVSHVSVSPDGTALGSASWDGTFRVRSRNNILELLYCLLLYCRFRLRLQIKHLNHVCYCVCLLLLFSIACVCFHESITFD